MQITPVLREDNQWNAANEDEMEWWPRALWIDPGKVSGVACVWFDPQAILESKPLPRCVVAIGSRYLHGHENGQIKAFMEVVEALDNTPGLAVGSESFVIGKFNQSADFLSPVRIRSAIEYQMFLRGKALWTQSPADAKNEITDARLQLWDMYVAGPDHQRDARRHALLWVKKLRGLNRTSIEKAHGEDDSWWSAPAESTE